MDFLTQLRAAATQEANQPKRITPVIDAIVADHRAGISVHEAVENEVIAEMVVKPKPRALQICEEAKAAEATAVPNNNQREDIVQGWNPETTDTTTEAKVIPFEVDPVAVEKRDQFVKAVIDENRGFTPPTEQALKRMKKAELIESCLSMVASLAVAQATITDFSGAIDVLEATSPEDDQAVAVRTVPQQRAFACVYLNCAGIDSELLHKLDEIRGDVCAANECERTGEPLPTATLADIPYGRGKDRFDVAVREAIAAGEFDSWSNTYPHSIALNTSIPVMNLALSAFLLNTDDVVGS